MSISPLKSIFKVRAQTSEVPEVVTRRKSLKKRLSSALKRLSFNTSSSNRLSFNTSSSNRLSFNQSLSKRSSDVSNWRILIEEDITKCENITKCEDITKGYVRMKPVPPKIRIPMDIRVQAWVKEAEEAAKEEVYVCMDSKNINIQKSEKI